MVRYKNQKSTAVTLGMLTCALVLLGSVQRTEAMFLFGSSNNSTPHQSIVKNNANTSSPSIDASSLTVAPEPASIWLLASGLLGLGVWRLRNNKSR